MEEREAGMVLPDGEDRAIAAITPPVGHPVEGSAVGDQAPIRHPTIFITTGETVKDCKIGLGKERAGGNSGYQERD